MTRFREVIQRPDYGPHALVPLAVGLFAWWMAGSMFVALVAFVAAAIVTAMLRPRPPGRWTE